MAQGQKYKPSKQDLDILQKMIHENESYTKMGLAIGKTFHTVKKVVKEYGLDVSNYDLANIVPNRKFVPSEEQVETIKSLIGQRESKAYIARQVGVSVQTLKQACLENNIDIEKHRARPNREFIPTKEQLDAIQSMLLEKRLYTDIAKEIGVNRNTVTTLVNKYALKSFTARKTSMHSLSQEEQIKIRRIKDTYGDKVTLELISMLFNKNKAALLEHFQFKRMRGQVDKDILIDCLKITFESDDNDFITKEDISYIQDSILKIPFMEICKSIKRSYRICKKIIVLTGINKDLIFEKIIESVFKEEFINDLQNNSLSNKFLSNKYGVSDGIVGEWRIKNFGEFKYKINNFINKTTPELMMEEILHSLDLTFFNQIKIEKWSIDYYLGQKVIVEVDGDYWHSLEKIKEKDIRKKQDLESKGYKVLNIPEKDIKQNPLQVKKLIFEEYIKSISDCLAR